MSSAEVVLVRLSRRTTHGIVRWKHRSGVAPGRLLLGWSGSRPALFFEQETEMARQSIVAQVEEVVEPIAHRFGLGGAAGACGPCPRPPIAWRSARRGWTGR